MKCITNLCTNVNKKIKSNELSVRSKGLLRINQNQLKQIIMKAKIITNTNEVITGELSSIDGDRICVDANELTPETMRALSDARCSVTKLSNDKWYIIARFDRINGYELMD